MEAYARFAAAMAVLEDSAACEADVLREAQAIRVGLREAENEETAAAASRAAAASFEYWCAAYGEVQAAPDRAALKAWMARHMCEPHEHVQPPYNVCQGMMKAAIHVLWRRLYVFEARRGHLDVAEAVRDAMLTPVARGQEYAARLLDEIAADRGLTAEQLMSWAGAV